MSPEPRRQTGPLDLGRPLTGSLDDAVDQLRRSTGQALDRARPLAPGHDDFDAVLSRVVRGSNDPALRRVSADYAEGQTSRAAVRRSPAYGEALRRCYADALRHR